MSFHTPGGHDAKRRRIEAANATLRKPFRSPLVNRQHHETPGPAATDSVTPHTPAPTRGSRHAPNTASPLSTSPTLTPWSPQPKDQAAATAASESLTSRPARRPLPIKNQITPRPQPQPQPRPQLQPRPRPGSQCAKRGGAPTTPTTAPQPAQGAKEEQQKQPGDDDDEEEEDEDDLLTRLATAQRTLHSHLRAAQSRLALVRQAAQIERQAASSSSSAAAATGRPVEPVGVVDLTGLIGKCKSPFFLSCRPFYFLLCLTLEMRWGYTLYYSGDGRGSSPVCNGRGSVYSFLAAVLFFSLLYVLCCNNSSPKWNNRK